MAQYFFKMTNEERDNILNQHKTIYDGYVTEYGQQSNTQPLYVQDYANDKEGMVVSNKGVVKPYTNMGINESHTGLDMIADDPEHLKHGTVDLSDYGVNPDNEMMHDEYPSPNEDEFDFISLGKQNDDDTLDIVLDIDELGEEHGTFDHMSDEYEDDDLNYGSMKRKYYDIDNTMPTLPDFGDDVEEEILPDFLEKLNESLDMFNRFKKYN
jgi:hypothetical protein